MLRLNADGTIPTDNPFFNQATGVNRTIWAIGLRNPFTFSIHSASGRMFINDVGEDTWEEINEGGAGENYGWPSTEGATNEPAFRTPLDLYRHGTGDFMGCAITGGAFYTGIPQQFPAIPILATISSPTTAADGSINSTRAPGRPSPSSRLESCGPWTCRWGRKATSTTWH